MQNLVLSADTFEYIVVLVLNILSHFELRISRQTALGFLSAEPLFSLSPNGQCYIFALPQSTLTRATYCQHSD